MAARRAKIAAQVERARAGDSLALAELESQFFAQKAITEESRAAARAVRAELAAGRRVGPSPRANGGAAGAPAPGLSPELIEMLRAAGFTPQRVARAVAGTGRRPRARRRAVQYDDEGYPIPARRRGRAPRAPRAPSLGGVGRAGGGRIGAGGAVTAVAAGVAAFFVTRALQKHLGRRAMRAEEAGVAAALANREARAMLAEQLGRPLTPAESRQLGAEYKRQLVALGYDPVTFTRRRSGAQRFFTSGLGED